MRFPTHELRLETGTLDAYIHENEKQGLARGLFWNLFIPFERVIVDGAEADTAVLVDWLTWPIRRWVELDGRASTNVLQPDLVEPFFYFFEHHWATLERLTLRRASASTFDVDVALTVDVPRDDGSLERGVRVETRARVPFEGLIVVSENFEPRLASAEEVVSVASGFLDLEDFQPPRWDRFRWIFAPIDSAT
ncbi:MAG: hypothetical protein HYR85_14185 [Planctomycetes bacterium]|nr:hypothetical protein [Planctomycetota bacterium]